jgi:hypothetical protein
MSVRVLHVENAWEEICITLRSFVANGICQFELVKEKEKWDIYPGDVIQVRPPITPVHFSQRSSIHVYPIDFVCPQASLRLQQAQRFYEGGCEYFDEGKHPLAIQCYLNALELLSSSDRSQTASDLQREVEFKISISAFYAGQSSLGQKYTDRMILSPHCPHDWTMRSLANYEFYVQPLSTISDQEIHLQPQSLPKIGDYRALNPSFIPRQAGGFWVNIRLVNWSVNPIGFNQYSSPDGKFRTKNALGWIRDFHTGGHETLSWGMEPRIISKEGFSYSKLRSDAVTGFEDVRLFLEQGPYLYFVCNCTKNHPHGRGRLSLGKIDKEHHPRYIDLQPLAGYGDEETQKNWLACPTKEDSNSKKEDCDSVEHHSSSIKEDYEHLSSHSSLLSTSEVEFIYGYAPFTKIAVNLDTSRVRPLASQEFPLRWDYFRGSASPIPFPSTEYEERMYPVASILVVHQVYFKDHGGRRYLHRFIYMNDERIPIGLSRPWFLRSDSIEYVSSLLYLDEQTIGIGYGYMDAQARFAQVKIDTIRQMFLPLSEYIDN